MDTYLTVWHCVYILIAVPTVLGNILILLTILRNKCLRSNMYILIGNLAVSDLIVGLLLIPTDLIGDMVGLNHNKTYCLLKLSLFVVSLGGSCCSLLLISIDRLIATTHPLTHRLYLKKAKLVVFMVIGWIIVTVDGTLPLMGWNRYSNNHTDCNSDHIYARGYQHFINIQFIAVLVGNVIMYAIVMRIAVMTAQRVRLREGIIHNRSERDFQKLKMMVTIFGVFIICWGPYAVILTTLWFYDTHTLRFARKCALIPGVINSALNWIIYGYQNKEFRTAFKEIVKCERNSTDMVSLSREYHVSILSSKRTEAICIGTA